MIVTIYKVTKEGRHELSMTGHADSDLHNGIDLVCASASGIVYALAARIDQLRHEHKARSVVMRLNKGDAHLAACPEGKCGCRLDEAYKTAYAGLELLSKVHPECITCDFYEVDE